MRIEPHVTFDTLEDQLHVKPRILVVDDDITLRKMLMTALERRYEVETLPSGLHLLDALQENPPDLIILDIRLPWKNGFDLCQLLKSKPQWRSIPILFLTSLRSNEDFASGIGMGAEAYMTKPFRMRELQGKVQELLNGSYPPMMAWSD